MIRHLQSEHLHYIKTICTGKGFGACTALLITALKSTLKMMQFVRTVRVLNRYKTTLLTSVFAQTSRAHVLTWVKMHLWIILSSDFNKLQVSDGWVWPLWTTKCATKVTSCHLVLQTSRENLHIAVILPLRWMDPKKQFPSYPPELFAFFLF